MTTLTLTGEQKKVLTLPVQHPVLIRGAAGSGKTTVAVYRARHLMQTQGDLFSGSDVALFTYTNSLVRYVRALFASDECTVTTLHSFAGSLLWRAGRRVEVEQEPFALESHLRASVDAARRAHPAAGTLLAKELPFFQSEFSWIKGRRLSTRDVYLATARKGRGTADRVTAADKAVLWSAFEAYNASLAAAHRVDWDDLILRALHMAETEGFRPPFSHIVVDEAQDLTLAQLSLVSRLVSPETDSITLVADSAQRIYQSGFTWSDTGLNVRGRSFEFRRNYRNTRPIAAAAAALLSRETERAEFTDAELPDRDGEKPRLIHAGNPARQFLCALREIRRAGPGETVAVVSPTRRGVARLIDGLAAAGIAAGRLNVRAAAGGHSQITVDTLHAVKGIEFDRVLLCDLNEADLPYGEGEEGEETRSRLRKLLYVGMTRARCALTLLTSDVPARLLEDIDPDLIERCRDACY